MMMVMEEEILIYSCCWMTTHVVGGDGAGRVTLDQLDPSRDAAEDELLLGPEHAA